MQVFTVQRVQGKGEGVPYGEHYKRRKPTIWLALHNLHWCMKGEDINWY
jgi:hypothetical protein